MKKLLCLGNEYVTEDSLAKSIGERLRQRYEVLMIQDSFQLMSALHDIEKPIILDVVKGLYEVRELSVNDLRTESIISAHDFDAAQVLKLVGKPVQIIGIPMQGNEEEITRSVINILSS